MNCASSKLTMFTSEGHTSAWAESPRVGDDVSPHTADNGPESRTHDTEAPNEQSAPVTKRAEAWRSAPRGGGGRHAGEKMLQVLPREVRGCELRPQRDAGPRHSDPQSRPQRAEREPTRSRHWHCPWRRVRGPRRAAWGSGPSGPRLGAPSSRAGVSLDTSGWGMYFLRRDQFQTLELCGNPT